MSKKKTVAKKPKALPKIRLATGENIQTKGKATRLQLSIDADYWIGTGMGYIQAVYIGKMDKKFVFKSAEYTHKSKDLVDIFIV